MSYTEIHFSIIKGKKTTTVDGKGAGQLAYAPAGLPGTLNMNKNQASVL